MELDIKTVESHSLVQKTLQLSNLMGAATALGKDADNDLIMNMEEGLRDIGVREDNMRILNLYANIGGNRKYWGDEHQITAVEIDPKIASIYQDFWPRDTVVVGDAHQYLIDHYKEFDFIWASPPCPTHSKARYAIAKGTDFEAHPSKQRPAYPDMTLYQEILFLQGYFEGKWCVENVIGWYEPLIRPTECGGHYFWTNFMFPSSFPNGERFHTATVEELQERKGFDLSKYSGIDKRLMLRDITEPELGKHILDWSQKEWHHTKSLLHA